MTRLDDVILDQKYPWYYKAPAMAVLVYVWVLLEKMVAHIFLVTLIYAGMPIAIAYIIAAVIGAIGLLLVWKGLHQVNEVKATWLGYVGGAIIWTFWFEMYLHFIGAMNMYALGVGEAGVERLSSEQLQLAMSGGSDVKPYFMGEHVFLQSSSLFCFMLMIYMFMNKDVRCRMILWLRKLLRLRPGKPTKGYQPQFSRVAATEVMFVNWFMYTLMLIVNDERILGLHHPVTYVSTALVVFWAAFVLWKQTQQREVGLSIRYAIGAVAVMWFVPEQTTLWGWYKEPWVYYNDYPITASLILISYVVLMRVVWKTPTNPETGKSLAL